MTKTVIERMAEVHYNATNPDFWTWYQLDKRSRQDLVNAMAVAVQAMPDIMFVEVPESGRYRQGLADVKDSLLQELATRPLTGEIENDDHVHSKQRAASHEPR